jgi:hypothetical protein
MEATSIAMQGNKMVPAWIVDGIANPHFQRFLACLALDRGTVARERRRFHGL